MRKRNVFVGICVIFVLLFTTSTVLGAHFEDTVQRHENDNLSDVWSVETTTDGCVAKVINSPSEYPLSKSILLAGEDSEVSHVTLTTIYPYPSTYWSFVMRDGYLFAGEIKIYFYDEDGYEITELSIADEVENYHSNDLWEIVITGGEAMLYVNGEEIKSLGGCDRTPNYIRFYVYADNDITIDDINTFPVIGLNEEYTELNNWINMSYTTKRMDVYPDAEYKFNIKKISNQEIIKSTTILNDPTNYSSDFIENNRSEVFGFNYGTYEAYITRDGEERAQTTFAYEYSENLGYVSFDNDSYVGGETGELTYHLESPSFGDYEYEIDIMNIAGETEETYSLASGDGTESVSFSGWDSGNYYIELTRTSKSTGNIKLIDYDIIRISKEVHISGKTYNAQTGDVLGNVTINVSQGSEWYNTTSNTTTGEYNLSGLLVDTETEINASKSGYTHKNFSWKLLTSKKYEIDLYLLNKTPTYSGTAILGLVENYPLHQAINNTTVRIWNTSWNTTTTTSETGYYLFEDLEYSKSVVNETFTTASTSVANETFNSGEYDAWVSLNYTELIADTELVSNTTDEDGFEKDSDYEMNYSDGTIKVLSSGNMSNQTDYHIDYDYNDWAVLNHKDIVPDSQLVSNTTDETAYTNDTDYEMNFSGGEIRILTDGDMVNDTDYHIDYDFEEEDYTYNLNATKANFGDSENKEVTVNIDSFEEQNFLLHPLYELIVKARDGSTHATLKEFEAVCNETSKNTTDGTVTFTDLDYGTYTVGAYAEDYYGSEENVLVDEDRETVIYLTKLSEGGPGVEYPPHYVLFTVKNLYGQPLGGVDVDVSYTNGTSFGSGYTGADGGIGFEMIEITKYNIEFTYNSWSDSIGIYPTSNSYTIIAPVKPTEEHKVLRENVKWNFSTSKSDDTHRYFNFSYEDGLDHTTEIKFSVLNKTRDEIYNETVTDTSSKEFSYTASPWEGKTFYAVFEAKHEELDDFGEGKYYVFHIEDRLIDLKLDEDWHYQAISIALLILLASLFSAVTVMHGAVVVALFGNFFYFINWLEIPSGTIIMPTVLVLSALIYMSKKGRKEGVT